MSWATVTKLEDTPPNMGWLKRGTVRDAVEDAFERQMIDNRLVSDNATEMIYDLADKYDIDESDIDLFIEKMTDWKNVSNPTEATQFIESAFIHAWSLDVEPRGDFETLNKSDLGDGIIDTAALFTLISQEAARVVLGESFRVNRAVRTFSHRSMAVGFLTDLDSEEFTYEENPIVNYSVSDNNEFRGQSSIGKTISYKEVGFAPDIAIPINVNADEGEVNLVGGTTKVKTQNWFIGDFMASELFDGRQLDFANPDVAKSISKLSGAAAEMSRFGLMTTDFVYTLMDLQMQNYHHSQAYTGFIKKALKQWDNPDDIDTYRRMEEAYEEHREMVEMETHTTLGEL